MTRSARSSLMVTARVLNTLSSDALNFSMHPLTDSASIRAWAGSYTPQGRSQWAWIVSGRLNRSARLSRRATIVIREAPCDVEMVRELLHPTHWLRRFRRVQVAGDSMRPDFEAGDRLLLGPPLWVRPGQVVAVTDPRDPGRLMVKRVHAIEPIVGRRAGRQRDRPAPTAASSDPSPARCLAGRVIYRYAPAGRTGWFPGRLTRRAGSRPGGSARAAPPNPRR